jgi:hypothetical protein
MIGKSTAVLATAAFCAGFFASAVPRITPHVLAGALGNSRLVVPKVIIDKIALRWVPMAAAFNGFVEGPLANYNWGHRIARVEGWPSCDPTCWTSEHGTGGAKSEAVVTVGRSAANTSAKAMNPVRKADRFPEGLLAKQRPSFSPRLEMAPASSKPMPPGCEPAFSSVADPAHAHLYGRCLT